MIGKKPILRCESLGWLAAAAVVFTGAARANPSPYPIKHVIIIMQENRSFDSYFGTYPGANGIPPGTCVPINPSNPSLGCVAPFHDPDDVNAGALHNAPAAEADLDDGVTTDKMDGFIYEQDTKGSGSCSSSLPVQTCSLVKKGVAQYDVMGYHIGADIPNYWSYAQNFVLQDQMFQDSRSWSWPTHLYLTSEWSANCTDYTNASTCSSNPMPNKPVQLPGPMPWVSIFQLLDTYNVSWKYYLGTGTEPDCNDDAMTCDPQIQTAAIPSIWNPAPEFAWVKSKGKSYLTAHNPPIEKFLADIKAGTLPSVSWIIPSDTYSEHPPNGVTMGMEYVTSLVNAVMQSPYWANTAIFVTWDDWGGFYDHVIPPTVDTDSSVYPVLGYGIRVPGLMISAYAKPGYIDHSVLSFDSYAIFIENLFTGGARLDPVALGNPDNRPDLRDSLTSVTFPNGTAAPIGNLLNEFDFTQAALPPIVLSTHIPTAIHTDCSVNASDVCTTSTVQIAWHDVTGTEVPGPFTYHVQRNGVELPQCESMVNFCKDTPGSGIWYYRAYTVDANNVASPLSAAAEANEP